MTTDSASYLAELHQLLNQSFNLEEINTLCLQLNLDHESIAGREKPARIRELLLALGRNGRLPELVSLAQTERPHLTWPPVPANFQLPPALAPGGADTPVNQYHVYGDMVQGDKIGGDKVEGDKITVGNISNAQGIAIGRGAKAEVTIQHGSAVMRHALEDRGERTNSDQ